MISIKGSGTIQQAAGRHRQAITATDLYKAVVVEVVVTEFKIGSKGKGIVIIQLFI